MLLLPIDPEGSTRVHLLGPVLVFPPAAAGSLGDCQALKDSGPCR